MSKSVTFVGTCVHLRPKDLDAYDDSARDIGYNRFRYYVGDEVIDELNSAPAYRGSGLTIKKDYAVSYSRGKWRGRWAVCMMWSSIHHIWTIDDE
jgi:hypothetical protein